MFTTLAVIAGILFLYGSIAIAIYIFQPRLVYRPDARYTDPNDIGLKQVSEIKLKTPDGEELVAWYAPAEPGYPTILYYHGTNGSLVNRRERIHRMTRRGYGVFMPSYRGYSGSTGRPSQGWLTVDALAAYDYLRDELRVTSDKIVIYGESLGTGIATPVATVREIAALVLEAPYTSIVDIAKKRFPWLPAGQFLLERFESIRVIDQVKAPLLIIHGAKDKLIPVELGKQLFEAASEPKDMIVYDDAAHTGLFMMGAFTQIQEFLERHLEIPQMAVVTQFKKSAAE